MELHTQYSVTEHMKIFILIDIENQHDMEVLTKIEYHYSLVFELHAFYSSNFKLPSKTIKIFDILKCTLHVAKTSLPNAADVILIEFLSKIKQSGNKVIVLSNDKVIHTATSEFNDYYNIDVCNTNSFDNVLDSVIDESHIPDYPKLLIACRRGDLQVVEELIRDGVDIDSHLTMIRTDDDEAVDYEITSLLIACEYGQIDVIKFLISKGANIEVCNSSDYTPLMIMVSQGCTEIVELLIKSGANVNSVSITGYRPNRYMGRTETISNALSIATNKKDEEMIKLLKVNGANLNRTGTKFDPRMYY
ncbi:hypothetical protein HK103_003709 [Boothiomyces macroporosus]|uniref:Ankyrin repeat protein n=1 Tax=Boothiomyces macroporosus TaxID=261099 RepID=A0AAD5XZP6_9FUNG|nr:hypothetical protein HK103_003709 [Boothiomyces macroporosus]